MKYLSELSSYRVGYGTSIPIPRPIQTGRAFTLIELLVVISIIALLVGILLPALGAARRSAYNITCVQNEQQIGVGLTAYSIDYRDALAVNPAALWDPQRGYFGIEQATNAIYTQPSDELIGLGLTLDGYISDPRAMFCLSDNSTDPTEELDHLKNRDDSASCSYFYRQLDRTTDTKIDFLGESYPELPATALLVDANTLITDIPNAFRTNHDNTVVNILYNDGHVSSEKNGDDLTEGLFSISNQDFQSDPMGSKRLDQIFVTADFALIDNPNDAPDLDETLP